MAEARTNGFRWLASYYEATRDLPDQERLLLYDAVLDFGFGNEPPELPAALRGLFLLMKPTIERSIRFEEKQKANGERGGRPKKTQKDSGLSQNDSGLSQNASGENLAIAVDVANTVDVANAFEGEAPGRFIPPTLEEVEAYITAQGFSIDAQEFLDFYEGQGWLRANGQPVVNWKAVARSWERRSREKKPTEGTYSDGLDIYGEGV